MQLSQTVAPASREWMQQLTESLLREFGERLIFTGLQGSRARGEEDSLSDIDPVVVLDCLSAEDLSRIRLVYSRMPEQGELCGFVSGRQELACWDSADRLVLLQHSSFLWAAGGYFSGSVRGGCDTGGFVRRVWSLSHDLSLFAVWM